ncbi:MAG: TraX family protein [Oscillospiraceae bacterium]
MELLGAFFFHQVVGGQVCAAGGANGFELNYLMTVAMRLGPLLPMLLLGRYNGKRGQGNKWLFYCFYPAHLLMLFFVAKLLASR